MAPSAHIQSDAAAIVHTAQEVAAGVTSQTQVAVVAAILTWVEQHTRPGRTTTIADAVTCLNSRQGNCIGLAHLSVALLRAVGIPARTVRTFVVRTDGGLDRYHLIEAYFPQDGLWVLYEPHRYRGPSARNLYLYSDPDWNHAKHKVSKAFSQSAKTRVGRKP